MSVLLNRPTINAVNCRDTLRAMDTTTQKETLNVTVQKGHRLGNPQPSLQLNEGRFNDHYVGPSGSKRSEVNFFNLRDDLILHKSASSCIIVYYESKLLKKGEEILYTIRKPIEERFEGKYEKKENGCWEWQGALNRYGYALLFNGPGKKPRFLFAHRASWMIHFSSIPEGLHVLHKCDNRKCVNPDHLFLGTKIDNNLDRDQKSRQAFGQRNGNAIYKDSDIIEIYKMSKSGMSNPEIAKKLNGSRITIWEIITGRKWAHLFKQRYGK